jgi:hypothetical protein
MLPQARPEQLARVGREVKTRGQGFAIQRAQCAERPTRVLSVAMPVLAYIAGWGM